MNKPHRSRDEVAAMLSRESQAAAELLQSLKDDLGDDEEFAHDVIEGETDLLEAVGAALTEIDQCELVIAGCKDREAVYAKRRKRAEDRRTRVRTLIEQAMARVERNTIRTPHATFTLKEVPPAVRVREESEIPTRFWKIPEPVLDKKALNEAMAEASERGESIPGAEWTNGGIALQIRRA